MEETRSFGYICPKCGKAVMARRNDRLFHKLFVIVPSVYHTPGFPSIKSLDRRG